MIRIKKINYLLPIVILCLLSTVFVQGQTPEISITLTWSADTYAPVDYMGKSLPTKGSSVKVAAVINSLEFNPQELIYKWFLNDHIQKSDSGQNKQVFQFNMDKNRSIKQSIKVKIENSEGILLGTSSYLYLKPQSPEIILETNIFSENPNEEYKIPSEQEVKFIAKPYFFNIETIDELNYVWSLNGKIGSQVNNENPNLFTLKVGKIGEISKQDLIIQVENKNNSSEKAQSITKIIFTP